MLKNAVGIAALAIPFALSAPFAASAADTGELWEVTATMNIPGLPAGMGGRKSQVCTDKSESPGAGRKDCKVSNLKRSGLTESMTMTCPDATMTVEMTYNAARTEYKGTMRMTSKDGEMTMNTAGRKLGACDPQVARAEQQQKAAKATAQAQAQIAAGNQAIAQNRQQRLDGTKRACTEAVSTMDYHKMAGVFCFGETAQYEMHCTQSSRDAMAKDSRAREALEVPAEAKTFCDAKRTEFCSNLQTPAGFQLAAKFERTENSAPPAKRIPQSSAFCGLKAESVAASVCSRAIETDQFGFLHNNCRAETKAAAAKLCPRALEKEAYYFLGIYCPAQAKPLYAQHCAGRDYTSLYQKDKKTLGICHGIGLSMEERSAPQAGGGSPAPAPAEKKSAVDSATQGVQQGINKLKGLFGR